MGVGIVMEMVELHVRRWDVSFSLSVSLHSVCFLFAAMQDRDGDGDGDGNCMSYVCPYTTIYLPKYLIYEGFNLSLPST